jgi:two-component system, chemotaxis family, CheB/CheR fusion protein
LFHYALNPGGVLFLGTSETVGEFADLFATLDRKAKLYQRKADVAGAHRSTIGKYLSPVLEVGADVRRHERLPGENKHQLRELTERVLLQQYAPVGALVDQSGGILYLHGRTGLYLEPAPGEASMNILTMARDGLRRDLTTSLHRSVASHQPVRQSGLRVKTNGDFTRVDLAIQPVAAGSTASTDPTPLFLVTFTEAAAEPQRPDESALVDAASDAGEVTTDSDTRVAALKNELRAKEEFLQTTNEELETTNEELKSSNEEMQSVNEELQSANEELETSKEELQSVNEELTTVNAELQAKLADLSRANNDMNNLLAGTGIGTVFVDHQLRIQRFTPAVTQVINLILTDVGRPVGHIVSNLADYDRLVDDVRTVLETLVPIEVEVQTNSGAWYLLRIRPYRTQENLIEGAVITFTEITEMKAAQTALREAEALRVMAAVVRDANDAVLVLDLQGRILAWNPEARRTYGWSEDEALAMNVRDLVPEDQREQSLTMIKQLARAEVLEPYRLQRIAKDGQNVEVWLTATALVNATGEVYALVTTERTGRQQDDHHAS